MQFYFILSTYNYHIKVIHHKGQKNIRNNIFIKLIVVFLDKD